MTIEIKVGDNHSDNGPTLKLKIRKTIDGQIMIMDHNEIDIVVMPEKKKIITFPKKSMHDSVYACQERFFNYLSQKGVINRESVQSGDVYGSIQAEYPDAVNEASAAQLVVFTIGKFLEEEKPHMELQQELEDEFEKELTNPDEEDSTELGEVPHSKKKGSIDSGNIRRYLSGFSPY